MAGFLVTDGQSRTVSCRQRGGATLLKITSTNNCGSPAYIVPLGMNTPSFSSHLFWDTDPLQTDWHTQAEAVLTRVLNRGSLEDIVEAEHFYGIAPIQKLLQHSRSLSLEGRRLAELVVSTL